MDGLEIINSFNKETIYEFSEAFTIFEDEIYFIFKVDIISIDANPSKTKDKNKDKTKDKNKDNNKERKDNEKAQRIISHLEIEPIAYLLKKAENEDYQIEAIDEKYTEFIEKNKDKLLKEFLNQ